MPIREQLTASELFFELRENIDGLYDSRIISSCKEKIAYRTRMAGLEFFEDDVICVPAGDGGHIVFLRRFFMGYQTDEEGNHILDEDLKPIPLFRPTVYLDDPPRRSNAMQLDSLMESGIIEVSIPIPRVVVVAPWVFFRIKGDEIIDGDAVGFNV